MESKGGGGEGGGTFNFFLNGNSCCLLNMKSALLLFHKPIAIILTIVKPFQLQQQAHNNTPTSGNVNGS